MGHVLALDEHNARSECNGRKFRVRNAFQFAGVIILHIASKEEVKEVSSKLVKKDKLIKAIVIIISIDKQEGRKIQFEF